MRFVFLIHIVCTIKILFYTTTTQDNNDNNDDDDDDDNNGVHLLRPYSCTPLYGNV